MPMPAPSCACTEVPEFRTGIAPVQKKHQIPLGLLYFISAILRIYDDLVADLDFELHLSFQAANKTDSAMHSVRKGHCALTVVNCTNHFFGSQIKHKTENLSSQSICFTKEHRLAKSSCQKLHDRKWCMRAK